MALTELDFSLFKLDPEKVEETLEVYLPDSTQSVTNEAKII
jgi:hypothetical protein